MISFIISSLLLPLINAQGGYFYNSFERVYSSGIYNTNFTDVIGPNSANLDINSQCSTANNPNRLINEISTQIYDDDDEKELSLLCKEMCNSINRCKGIYKQIEDKGTNISCSLLTGLGNETMLSTQMSSESYRKIIKYKDDTLDDLSIIVYNYVFYEHSDDVFNYNSTLYLDLNNNLIFDSGEPSVTVTVRHFAWATFSNITPGIYHIRQIIHNNSCTQIFPGLQGDIFYSSDKRKNHMIDSVVYWESSPHSHKLKGGKLNTKTNQIDYLSPSFDYIIGDTANTFLSFCPGETIVVSFIDELIQNNEGTDLFVNLTNINNSTGATINTYAKTYISYNNLSWTYIGIISYNNSGIDLSDFGYQSHANYLKFEFMGDNHDEFMNISSIGISPYEYYYTPYSATIDSKYNMGSIIINDCFETRYCDDYCDLNIYDDNNFYECYSGCTSIEYDGYCDCPSHTVTPNGDTHNYCVDGCKFEVKTTFEDYSVLPFISGDPGNIIEIPYNHSLKLESMITYLEEIKTVCDKNDDCKAIELTNNGSYFYSSVFNKKDNNGSMLLIKGDIYTSLTTSPTSTPTTSPTNTETSTPTTSPTNTETSTPTTSPTSTPTTTTHTHTTTTHTNTHIYTQSINSSKIPVQTTTTTTTINTEPESSNNKNIDTSLVIAIIALVNVVILVIILSVAYAKYKNRNINRNRITTNTQRHISFDNPVYESNDSMSEEESQNKNNVLYKDIHAEPELYGGNDYETNI